MRPWRRRKNLARGVFAFILCLSVTAEKADSIISRTQKGSGLNEKKTQSQNLTKPQRHETIPRLLKGKEQRPLSHLINRGYPSSLQLLVEAEGEQLILSLEKNEGLFTSHYTETHYREDGSAVTGAHNFTNNCYYHGVVQGHSDSDVTLSACSGLLRGFISLHNRTYIIEPGPGRDTANHFIYRGEELTLPSGSCGHLSNMSTSAPADTIKNPFQSFHSRHKRHIQKTTKYVELIIVADNREFQKQGKDVEKVKQRLAEIANYVDKVKHPLPIAQEG